MVRMATTLTDDDINQYTDTEIIAIANRSYEVVNKKKIQEIDLILNVWFAVKQPSTQFKKEFPYIALNPVTQESVTIENKEQIYGILMNCYDEAVEKGFDVGEALFTQQFFFTDSNQLYNQECQNLIKKYIYCDTFNCPPYPSLEETPAEFVDNFLLIKKEINKARLKE